MDGADLISDRSINSRYVKNFGDDGMIVTVDKPDIRVLEELLEMEIIHPKAIIVHLTDKGRAIAENLVRMQEIMVSE